MTLKRPYITPYDLAALDVRYVGARGDGSTDDTAAFQLGLDDLESKGGGRLLVPITSAGYDVPGTLQLRNNVSIVGVGGYAKVQNLTLTNPASMFQNGNIHPNFTQDAAIFGSGSTYYPLNSVTQGDYTVRLTTSSNYSHFSAKAQVFVVSTAYTTVGGFGLFDYGFLNVVLAINTSTGDLTLKYPIDKTMSAQISNLSSNAGRYGVPLFFWENGSIENLDITASDLWVNDSASKNARYYNNIVHSNVGSYGNTYQDCDWQLNSFYFGSVPHEQSCNSLRTRTARNRYFFENGGTLGEGFYFQERSRGAVFEDNYIDLGSGTYNAFLFQIYDAQGTRIRGNRLKGLGGSGLQGVYMIGANGDAFGHANNKVDDNDFEFGAISRWVYMDGDSTSASVDNAVTNNRFSGATPGASDAVRIQNMTARNEFSRNTVNSGSQAQLNSCTNMEVFDNYIDGGFVNQTTGSMAELEGNYVRRNSNAKSIIKEVIRQQIVNVINCPNGASTDFYIAAVGANMQFWDVVTFDITIQPVGNTDPRNVVFYIYDHTTSTEIDLATVAIPAASTDYVSIEGTIKWMFGTAIANLLLWDQDGTNKAVPVVTSTSTPTATDNIDIRVKGVLVSGGNTQLNITQYTVDHYNPWYS